MITWGVGPSIYVVYFMRRAGFIIVVYLRQSRAEHQVRPVYGSSIDSRPTSWATLFIINASMFYKTMPIPISMPTDMDIECALQRSAPCDGDLHAVI